MPASYDWEKYMEWAKEYNTDILHLDAAGTSIVVLDTYEACCELLDKRARFYSDRPAFPMTIDLLGMDFNFAFLPYGEKWRARRRLAHEALHAKASLAYHPLSLESTHAFLRAMLDAGEDDLEAELRLMAGHLILAAAYGVNVQTKDDPHVVDADSLLRMLTDSAVPGAFLVNSIPVLKYVPEWMPGAGFQRLAREWRPIAQEIMDRPFYEIKQSMVRMTGHQEPSFVSRSLQKGADDRVIRDAAATMYNGGTDTTVVTLLNFTLAMLDKPDLQSRAQAHLDEVLGPLRMEDRTLGRLPTIEDEQHLPFITALVRESSRYMPVLPVSVPHAYCGDEPDVYKGYAIPCGSIVIPNVWSMTHEEAAYPDPYAFKPERFLTADGRIDPDVRDPGKLVFGFGRRNCIGRHMAYASLWVMVASILRVFNIEKAKRPDGTIIEPTREWPSSLIQNPKHFKCLFVSRSSDAASIVRATEGAHYD
ncbi:cytochrome P450 [Schizophyllum fasciatum]